MVVLWMGGKQIETVEDANLIARLRLMKQCVEMRDESGTSIGHYLPTSTDNARPWDADPTPEELEQILAGPSYTYEEVKQMLGWK